MRMLVLAALAITAFAATMTIDRTDANAVVFARGVYRAGCVGPHGAVVVHRPTTGTVIRSHTAPTPRVRKGCFSQRGCNSAAAKLLPNRLGTIAYRMSPAEAGSIPSPSTL